MSKTFSLKFIFKMKQHACVVNVMHEKWHERCNL